MVETENLTGATGASVTPNVKTYAGFIAPATQTGEILADGTLEINYYYERRKDLSYTVKYLEKGTNKEIKEAKEVTNQKFETEITARNEIENDIYGYKYDSVNIETLKIAEGENILIIYYTKKDTKIIIHHYLYNGKYTETKLTEDIEIEGKVGDTYTTSKSNKVTQNYKCLEEEPENHAGKMTEEAKEICYYYELQTPTVESNVGSEIKTEIEKNEEGNYEIKKGQEIKYKIEYETKIENYIGKAKIEIIAKLPIKIDIEKTDFSGGTYDPEANTIKWTKEEEDIDTFQNGTYTEKIEKEITLVFGENFSIENPEELEIKVEGKTLTYYPENYPEKGGENFVEEENKETGTIIIHHYIYDIEEEKETKEKLAEDEKIEGEIGKEYTTKKSSKIPQNYELVNEKPENYTGKIAKKAKEVRYYYKLIKTNIEDKAESTIKTELKKDENGNYIIKEGKEIEYKIEYETKIENYIGKAKIEITAKLAKGINAEKSDLAGGIYDSQTNTIKWTKEIENIDTFENGNYTEKIKKEITIVYKEDITITDKKDIEIKVEGKTITYYPEGYLDKGGQENQNIKEPEKKTGKIIVKYIDQDTNKEITNNYEITGNIGEEYQTEKKEIPYYKYEKDSKNTKGTITEEDIEVTYYYKKLNFNFRIENTISSITLNGEKIKISNNKLAKIEIPSKEIGNTELIINYNIKVTNNGEIAGTAKISQTIPDGYDIVGVDDWTRTSDVYLEPGETKTLSLTLKWQNAEKNLGSKIALSKIESTKNEANFEETNKNDNQATSTIIVSIKTGVIVSIAIIIMIITSLLICGYIIITTTHRMGKEPNIKDIGFLKN